MGGRLKLESELRSVLRGEVLFGPGDRALYATDASNYRKVPIGIVRPADVEDTAAALRICAEHRVPVLPRGAGTSLAGQCCNEAVILDVSRHLDGILEVDLDRRIARVEPGVVLQALNDRVRPHGLTFAPDPATHEWCTVGGMLGNDSCGVHSVMAGRTSDNVEALDVLLADGTALSVSAYDDAAYDRVVAAGGRLAELLVRLRTLRDAVGPRIRERFPRIPRRVSGYNLDELLPERGFHVARSVVGSEGTCATVVGATLRLVPWPRHRALVLLGWPSLPAAADRVLDVLACRPIGLEGMDRLLVEGAERKHLGEEGRALLPEGEAWLFVEVGAESAEEVRGRAEEVARLCRASRVLLDPHEQEQAWKVRETGLPATTRPPDAPDTWEGWEDAAVPPERLGDYLRDFGALLARFGWRSSLYGHFGEGCVHARIPFGLRTPEGVRTFRRFVEEAADLVLRYGGSLSGEHGDGRSRSELLGRMFGDELVEAFRSYKRAWDPDGRMNPGHVVDPYPLDVDLRVANVPEPAVRTVFRYRDDGGSLLRATERCVGVGRCLRTHGGTMCPSYQVLRDERHTTRGRAHLLYEMLRPDSPVSHRRLRSAEVHDALSLCLSCKGCKRDCPMGVDVATWKAEFSHRWYRFRPRPRIAYVMGAMPWIARFLPPLPANALLDVFGSVAARVIGAHPDRPLPRFARRTFRRAFRERPPASGDPVLLWADTWTDRFHPEVGLAAARVLERAGFAPAVLPRPVCCGRSLYDFGMLGPARRTLRACVAATRPFVERGVPIVVLEPSCASVFRDELRNLFPDDAEAQALARSVRTLSELLGDRPPPGRLERDVVFHGHCHHKAVLGTEPDVALLRAIGAEVDALDAGCCGMSGIFGYEHEKYALSVAIAEHGLLPAVRAAGEDAIVCADGFSCRTQLRDLGGRRALHLAQVLDLAR